VLIFFLTILIMAGQLLVRDCLAGVFPTRFNEHFLSLESFSSLFEYDFFLLRPPPYFLWVYYSFGFFGADLSLFPFSPLLFLEVVSLEIFLRLVLLSDFWDVDHRARREIF